MSNSRVFRTFILLTTIYSLSLPAYAKYSGGTGEPNDPYQIAMAKDLILLGDSPKDYDKHFVLTADIDLDPNLPGRKVFDRAVIAPDIDPNDEWLGFQGTPFTGVFKGNGHVISNLHIEGSVFLGLFGQLGEWGRDGEVTNLGVVDVNITGSGEYISGLVGFNVWSTMSNCYSTGTVNGDTSVGGLVGYNYGIVHNSYSIITVSGNDNVGGLVGSNGCDVSQSFSSGVVNGNRNVGGLVGINEASHTWWRLDSTITQCYSTCDVIGIKSVGGLLGHNMDGRDDPYVGQCYSTGAVSGSDEVGGLIGFNNRIIASSFWDIETSGQSTGAGGTGKTTTEMQDPDTFMDADWDFVGQPDGPHDIWAEPFGGGYPILCWQLPSGYGLPDFPEGTGESDDPYLISKANELNSIGHNPRLMDAHFMLINDIDMTEIDFYIIGSGLFPFTGVFDGNSHKISNFRYVSTDGGGMGLFGYILGADIKDLGLVDPNVYSETGWGGSLVGHMEDGDITNCYVQDGNVSGGGGIGGLVGSNYSGTITNCYAKGGSVMKASYRYSYSVGGLVGSNSYGIITGCHVDGGNILGNVHVGGLVGFNTSILTQCHATGKVVGTVHIGGLVGTNEGTGTITCSNAICTVQADGAGGGLVGVNHGSGSGQFSEVAVVSDCYSIVLGGSHISGLLVGQNGHSNVYYGCIKNCYASSDGSVMVETSGLVGTNVYGEVTNCFWDAQVTGVDDNKEGGVPLTTTEMQTAITFLEAGWDFVDETTNGTEGIWWILEGKDYPRLWWEWTEN